MMTMTHIIWALKFFHELLTTHLKKRFFFEPDIIIL